MKMTPEHYSELKEEIVTTLNRVTNAEMGIYRKTCEERGLTPTTSPMKVYLLMCQSNGFSDKRARWDLLWESDKNFIHVWFVEVYSYLDDRHVDTALRRIVKELLP